MVMTPKFRDTGTPQKDDRDKIGNYICELYKKRAEDRKPLDLEWDEIERQLRMEKDPERVALWGRSDETRWMPVIELPWQAETHELLTADLRRIMWPSNKAWFQCNPDDTDEIFTEFAETLSESLGTEVDVTSKEVASVVESSHLYFQDLYDFRAQWDLANGDAVTYGYFVLRGRLGELSPFSSAFRGVTKSRKLPLLSHVSARSCYLDDQQSAIHQNGMILRPLHLVCKRQNITDLKVAISKGSTDPTNELKGGWIKNSLDGCDFREGEVEIIEAEGDLIVPTSEGALIYENVLVNVIIGTVVKGNQSSTYSTVYRFRRSSIPFSSLLVHHYHRDQPDSAYGTSPLMKGRTLQKLGSEAAMRLAQAIILSTEPPIGYDRADAVFAAAGGPIIAPRQMWATLGEIKPHQIGEPEKMYGILTSMKSEYQDVTSMNAPRLGQQTKSHQTAFAVDTEVQRSVIRTVDFARSTEDGPATTWLHMEAHLMREAIGRGSVRVYVDEFKQWLDVTAKMIPERSVYDVTGAAEPIEDRQEQEKQTQALSLLMQADQGAVALGFEPSDWDKIRKFIAKEGFGDAEIFQPKAPAAFGGAPSGPPEPPSIPGTAGTGPGDDSTALATGTVNRGLG